MNINSVKDINANEKLHDYSGRSPFSDLIKFGTFAFANYESGGVWKNSSNLMGRVEEGGGIVHLFMSCYNVTRVGPGFCKWPFLNLSLISKHYN